MLQLLSELDIKKVWFFFFSVLSLRYFLIAGIAFVVFYVIKKKQWQYKRIQFEFPSLKDYQREILYSLFTFCFFAVVGVFLIFGPIAPYTLKYASIEDNGLVYYVFSIVLMIILHDAYFYWSHRLMHHPKLFRFFHKVHHQSTNPSPWAAFSFHPLEAFVEAGIIGFIVFLIPFHSSAVMIFLVIMTMDNVMGHLGYEIFPKGMNRHWLGKWINTSVNHNMHHKYFHGNYGLYFTFWDRIMGTTRPEYDEVFDEVTNRRGVK